MFNRFKHIAHKLQFVYFFLNFNVLEKVDDEKIKTLKDL